MAKISTTADIKDADDGDIIKCFEGTIVKAYGEYKSGSSSKGDWSFQHFLVKDEDGEEIKLTFKNRDELPTSWKGKDFTIRAHQGSRDWSGLYAKDDEYDGKTTRILYATATAEMLKGHVGMDGESDSDSDRDRGNRDKDRDNDRDKERGRDRGDDKHERDRDRKSKDPVDEMTEYFMRKSNIYGLALDSAHNLLALSEQRNNTSVPPDVIFATATTLFIQCCRDGMGGDMPTEPLWDVEADTDKEQPETKEDEKKGNARRRK